MRDALGQRGEALFNILITPFHGQQPLFRPQFLGDKWPVFDFFVELVGAGPITPFFFVQIKTTQDGYTKKDNRLKVRLDKRHVDCMESYPAPTYLVGIDERLERGFLVSVNSSYGKAASSLTTEFPLDVLNRERLWNEVKDYWDARPKQGLDSYFRDSNWR